MKLEEYNYQELSNMLDYMKRMYDTVRLVDPVECRELSIDASGGVRYGKECYEVWNASSRCSNCSSYRAVMANKRQVKEEIFENKRYIIQSIPISIGLPDGKSLNCVMELISIDVNDTETQTEPPQSSPALVASNGMQIAQGVTESNYALTHDLLTRLYNLDGICREVRRLLVDDPDVERILITGDIRHFRILNERYGRQRGNEVLIAIADMLRKLCGEDTVYGRTHADHFVLVMPEMRFNEGVFLDAVEEIGQLIDTENYHLYFHLGVYRIEDPDIPVTSMIEKADLALQTLHEKRENILMYYTDRLLRQSESEADFINDFEKNLEEGQFHIFLQPIFNPERRIVGAEALTRWIKPDGTIVPSEKYIRTLEKNDLITKLDYKNWELVMKQLREWQNTSRNDLVISVNVCPKDFFYIDALKVLKELVHNYRVDSDKLLLEFSEVDLMNDTEKQFELIDAFRAGGFKVAIDNFGVGNVSLNMLKDIHADFVKFDRVFISGSTTNERSRMVLESSVALCHSLGFKTVAEGIETQEQLDYLTGLGFDRYQGYHLSHPLPISEFEKLC